MTIVSEPRRNGKAYARATALEVETEEFLRKRVRLLGGYCFKWTPTIAGVPDRMVLMPGGRIFFVELKREGEKPEPIQIVWHARLREKGFHVVVIDSKAGVLTWLREVVDASGPQNGKPGRRPAK